MIAVWILLWIGVAAGIVTAAGILVVKDVFDRLHFLAPAATVGMVAIAAAVVIQEGGSQAAIKAVLVAIVVLVMNAILTHATARAARVHRFGQVQPKPEEHIEIVGENRFVGQKIPKA